MDPIFFRSAFDLRDWLERNHATTTELWVGFYKKSAAQSGITYPEAVDQALCYGWIDGIRKGMTPPRTPTASHRASVAPPGVP
jgi:uncharacterized protein YdeI (YjbR/CyaY-like superfamily)